MDDWRDVDLTFRRPVFRAARIAGFMILCGIMLVLFSLVTFFSTASAQPVDNQRLAPFIQSTTGDSASEGKAIFDEKCAGCHTVGNGKLVGPDLMDVTKRRDSQWIKDFIMDPAKMLASDPTAQQLLKENNNVSMPDLALSPEEIDLVFEYLSNPGAVPAAPAVVAPAGAGDPAVGLKLFTGEQLLTNGGPACMACHTVSGTGRLGGGGLGPDLTHVIQRLSEPGLTGALKTIAYPTMLGPFKNHPLTITEQADVIAFLKDADRSQKPVPVPSPGVLNGNSLMVFSIGVVAAGLLFGLLMFFWQRIKSRASLRLPVRKL